ncbi:hypothetical protein OG900_01970 [Streptomyces sp. NBC_00433]
MPPRRFLPHDLRGDPRMPDIAFLAIIVAVFAVITLVVKGVERL